MGWESYAWPKDLPEVVRCVARVSAMTTVEITSKGRVAEKGSDMVGHAYPV